MVAHKCAICSPADTENMAETWIERRLVMVFQKPFYCVFERLLLQKCDVLFLSVNNLEATSEFQQQL